MNTTAPERYEQSFDRGQTWREIPWPEAREALGYTREADAVLDALWASYEIEIGSVMYRMIEPQPEGEAK